MEEKTSLQILHTLKWLNTVLWNFCAYISDTQMQWKKLSERYKLPNLILKKCPYYLQEIKFAVNSLLTKKMSGLGFTGNCYQQLRKK